MNLRLIVTAILLATITACSRSNSAGTTQKPQASTLQSVTPNPRNDVSQVRASGQWDSTKARNIVISKLKGPDTSSTDEPCDDCPTPIYDVLDEFKFPYKNGEMMVVVGEAGTKDGNLTEGAKLSLFEFERRESGWTLIGSEMEVIEVGIHGFSMPEAVKMIELGKDTYGLSFRCYWMQQGESGAATVIMARLGNRFQEVLKLDTENDWATEGSEDAWTAQIKPVPGTKGFNDLVIKYTGARKGESQRFTFNGKEYEEIQTPGKR